MADKIITRADAKANGLRRYFTGTACRRGHIAQRQTSGGSCCECSREGLERKRRARGVSPRTSMTREEFLAKRRILDARWKARNRGSLAAKSKFYYWENKEVCDARNRERGRLNPEDALCRARAHKARRRNASGVHTKDDIRKLLAIQRGRCVNCRSDIRKRYDVDHIMPLARGGSNDRSNLQLLCPPCNHSKHARDPIEWAQSNGRLL